jgi:pseudaminic acid cytidylyltransferase
MNIAVIPARGGSKRIPRKNIKLFCGKPMIAWSIEAALKSECFKQVIVSTDDEEIALIAQRYGADVPFVRPKNLADDHTGTNPVIAHAIEWLNSQGLNPDFVCLIYATAPFICASDIQAGLDLIKNNSCDYVLSVTSFAFPIQRGLKIDVDGRVEMFFPSNFITRSQDLEESFHDAGQFTWGKTQIWLDGKPSYFSNSLPIRLPRHRVQDIDTFEDWYRAEKMMEVL